MIATFLGGAAGAAGLFIFYVGAMDTSYGKMKVGAGLCALSFGVFLFGMAQALTG